MIKIEQLDPKKLSPEDLVLLEKGCYGSYDKATVKDQVAAAGAGSAWIFRFSGDATGVFVLARGNAEERELVMTALAGKGLIRHFTEVYSEITNLVRNVGTRRLVGYVSRPGLASIYKNKTKARPVATLFSEDLT